MKRGDERAERFGTERANEELGNRQAGTPAATRKSRLWLWFVAAFLVQMGAWAVWFTIASEHRVQEVPLVNAEAGGVK